ncbi:hypothetical protein PR202_ga24562 [Eleusine coracana subsp. coracana]|uniref:Tyrosinase copper-binding domain-containing protein n=1 Tax=Eleusine coracana subsp. coracana TaxID=191504 RepID=A0AAV5D8P6_ELECO|nr:hypothetical protein QOZ80_9AG0677440 [Eleusine coracana subsp. coracana]GJN06800.1 hypothetical protein PR202_ga24562 [Eleusine coracana subsp. coracana]
MEASSSLRVFVLFMFALLAATTFLSLPLTPCSNSMSRAILTSTGLDPYLISCGTGDTAQEEAPLSKDNHGNNNRTARRGGPIVTDQLWCSKPEIPADVPQPPSQCCPPMSASPPINFTFPDPTGPIRTRRPVHEVGPEYMAKYERVVALMKALPKSDPRSFHQQAQIHCAYCTGAHRQVGFSELPVQVHYSWFFFPFHRAYLYFFERIARKLLDDPEFTVPFWSWDIPEGMQIPSKFVNKSSPLYDAIRDPSHQPPKLVDLDFWQVEKNLTGEQQIQQNMWVMYKQIVSSASLPSLFHGQPYRAGDLPMPGAGTVEVAPHNTVHAWIGNGWYPNGEDMGAYYTAGRDPIFYPFHSNIDRIWEAWRDIRQAAKGNNRSQTDFTDHAWLDSSFLFYDEEARLVRVTVRDMLDIKKLGYRFSKVAMPWATARPPSTPGVNSKRGVLKSVRFPVFLDAAMSIEVMRPDALQSRQDKDDDAPEEVLVVEGIEVQDANFVKFDVYVNAVEYHKVRPGGRELAGSFVSLRHPATEDRVKTSMTVALNELLEDLGVKEETSVTVTMVPVKGKVKIGGLKIVYMFE